MNYIDAMSLLSQSELGMLLVSKDDLILEFNEAASRLLNTERTLKGYTIQAAAPALAEAVLQPEGNILNIAFQKYIMLTPCPAGIEVPEGTRMICFRDVSGKMFRHMLESIVNLISEPMILTDSSQRVLLINNATSKMESIVPEEVIGKDITEVYPDAETTYSRESFHELTVPYILRNGKQLVDCRQKYTTKNGKELDISCSGYPIYWNGQICGVFCLTADLSRVEELSRQVIDLQERLLGKKQPSGDKHHSSGRSQGTSSGLYARYKFDDIVCQSKAMQNVIRKCHVFARSDSPIMVYGETGTGKELFVQSIHNASTRASGPFVAINCAAIPENLLESMLFGTEKGAYTGAEKRPGLFELADGGTLLLDELNSMSLMLQAKLLRVLQDGMIRRVGGTEEKKVDVRVISNVNIPPEKALADGIIREDVFYRLSVISVTIPPLRERREDIPLLARTFFVSMNRKLGKNITRLSDRVLSLFYLYDWPGNVRELQHCVEHAMNLVGPEESEISVSHLPEYFLRQIKSASDDFEMPGESKGLEQFLHQAETTLISYTLKKNGGNISRTAKELGVNRQNLQHRLKRLKIDLESE